MYLLRAINADTYGKTLFRKKTAPFVIEESAIGLDSIHNSLMAGLMLALKRHNLTEVVHPEEGWFPSMPGK